MPKKDFISLADYSSKTLNSIIKRAIELKKGAVPVIEKGKALALIFTKPSTRTNVSFQRAIQKLGGVAIYLGAETLQISRGETISDTAKTLSRYVDAIMIRTFSHQDVLDMAASASVPVINGLTKLLHPCQALGDIMSVVELKGDNYKDINMTFIGDGNNVCNSLINAAGMLGFNLTVASPEGYEPDEKILSAMLLKNKEIKIVHNPLDAVKDADIVYTDVWISMGQSVKKNDNNLSFFSGANDKEEEGARREKFVPFQVNSHLLSYAKDDVMVMHCLPARRGEEITDEVMDGKYSYIFEQAENRMHIQEAILEYLL